MTARFLSGEDVRRFWRKVDMRWHTECWPWLGATGGGGYGRAYIGSAPVPASRLAWSLWHDRPFPADQQACHTCDNPACVNPLHIWPGSASENATDCVTKGRHGGKKRIDRRTGGGTRSVANALISQIEVELAA